MGRAGSIKKGVYLKREKEAERRVKNAKGEVGGRPLI